MDNGSMLLDTGSHRNWVQSGVVPEEITVDGQVYLQGVHSDIFRYPTVGIEINYTWKNLQLSRQQCQRRYQY